jgi:hypothetical protein
MRKSPTVVSLQPAESGNQEINFKGAQASQFSKVY